MTEGNSLFNNFSFIGRLCNTPEKKVCKQGRVLFTQFLLKTKFGKKDVRIPLSMFGSCVDIVCTKYKIGDVVAVSGNCDFFSDYPNERLVNLDGTLIFLTHGNKYGVKSTLNYLKEKAKEEQADIVLFGHTHIPYVEEWHNIYFANPGTFQRKPNGMCSALEINIIDKNIDIKPIWIKI